MKKILIIFSFFVSFLCLKAQDTFTLTGKITNGDITSVDFIDAAKKQPAIKTKVTNEGLFSINSDMPYPGYYYLTVGQKSLIVIIHPGDKIHLEIDATDIYNKVKVEGSEDTKLVYNALIDFNKYIKQLDSINTLISEYKANSETEKMNEQIKKYQILVVEKDNFVRDLINNNKSSLASLLFIDNFKLPDEYELFKMLSTSLLEQYPDNIYVLDFEKRVNAESFLAVGTEAPEISLPNPEGEMISLSAFRGKVVLIDFWASWCGPCRRENPNMVRIYKDYKEKGFEIYGVSLDNSKDKWVATIASDRMSWVHVSDLKYWNSEAAKAYKVSSIPYTVLLDTEGKIIAKGLRGEALEKKLDEMLNHN
ncbi:MAG: TlpA family protein disulfide reductase [Bacteroidales bacterium]|nr:TlpA family protein disulfide reductase [Bacteroidales bacterium]